MSTAGYLPGLFNGWGTNRGYTAIGRKNGKIVFVIHKTTIKALRRKINGRPCTIKDAFGREVTP